MKFGTTIMGVPLRSFPEVAAAYEAAGFESIWVPEHLVFPARLPALYPYTESGVAPVTPKTPAYDPWVILAFLAAATERIRLATNVYILPLRHPLQTARSVVSLDRVSGGRVTLGVGVGWLPDEFDYLGIDFARRGARADATIHAIRRLWEEDEVEVEDEHFRFGPVVFQPKPLQKPSIPIEIGGASPPALRRAGRLGDGWIEIGSPDIEDFCLKLAVVRAARRAAGRTGPFEVTASRRLASDLDAIKRLEEAGATRVVVGPPHDSSGRVDPQRAIDWAMEFADEVMARAGPVHEQR